MTIRSVWVVVIALGSAFAAEPDKPAQELAHAAAAFLGSLSAEQRAAALLPFNSDERLDWHYVPRQRQGVSLKTLNSGQRDLAFTLLKTGLSGQGFDKVETVRSLEEILHVLEGGRGPARDLELYYFTVFGEPTEPNWGFRYEGHHISLHWTIVGGKVVSTLPQFLGANPAEVKEGPKQGTRTLAAEEDLARSLVASLDEAQRKEAILDQSVPPDIITGAAREAAILENTGIAYTALTADQQGVLISLLQVLADVQRTELAEQRMTKVREVGLEHIKFAWIGATVKGQKHYYRVQGPTFVVEYDNTQNNANHIHVVWRDFKGDFGMDALKAHYTAHADPSLPDEHSH